MDHDRPGQVLFSAKGKFFHGAVIYDPHRKDSRFWIHFQILRFTAIHTRHLHLILATIICGTVNG